MKISLDTNILLDTPTIVFDSSKEFVLSFTVIRELDKLKRNPDVKSAAQAAIKNIWALYEEDKIEILNIPDLLSDSPDEKIIQDTKDANASILSNDIAVRIIAKAHGIDISGFDAGNDIDYSYTGYQFVPVNETYIKELRTLKEMQVDEFEHFMSCTLKLNEYAIIEDGTEHHDIWKRKLDKVVRISQKMSPFTSAGVLGIQPMDPVQMCVLDAVMDNSCSITIISGKLGTGKTLLSMMSALATTVGEKRYQYYDKIYISASPESVNRNLYTGFKPGTSEEKLSGHLSGFKSNLKFLVNPKVLRETRKVKNLEEGSTPADEIWDNVFEVIEIDELQGFSLHHGILMVDEFQKLNEDALKMIASRIATGSKLILMGDTDGQVYGLNRGTEGFKKLFKEFGTEPQFNYIKMENIYRSDLAKFIARVFD